MKMKINQIFTPAYNSFPNRELQWVLHPNNLPDPKELIQQWQGLAETLVRPLESHWISKKAANLDQEGVS